MLELNLPIMLLHYLAKLNVHLYNFLSCGLVRWIAIVSVWEIYFIRLDIFSACSWRHYDVQLWYFTKRLTQHSTTYHGGIHWPVNGTSPSVRIGPLLEISVESRSDILKLTVKLRKWFHSANIHAFVCLSPGTRAQNAIYSYSHYIDDQQEVLHKLFKEPVPFLDPSDDLEQWFQGQVCGLGALSQKLSNLDV